MADPPKPAKPRWLYRFDNYKRAFGLLREAMELIETRPLTQLEREGVIQRFEYTWELAWKLIQDYLEREGVGTGQNHSGFSDSRSVRGQDHR